MDWFLYDNGLRHERVKREREAISSQFNDGMYGEVRMYDQPYMKFICLKLLHQFWCSNY